MSATKLILPTVEVAQVSDPGKDPGKQVNEDCVRYAETAFGHLAVLCDGMGGHEGGKEASNLAVETIFRHVSVAAVRADKSSVERAREVLRNAVAVANREVYVIGQARGGARPGSTVVAVLIHSLGTEVAHVGDSRCYLVHDGQIRQLTRDHSLVQQLVDAGKLTSEEAAVHPDASKITRALGMAPKVDIELARSSVVHVAGDVFVLCSDGLSDLVESTEILSAVHSSPPLAAATHLVDLANARGGYDNVSVVLLRARESAASSPDAASQPQALRLTEAMPVAAPSSERLGAIDAPSSRRPTLAVPDSTAHVHVPPAPPIAPRTLRRPGGRLRPSAAVALSVALAVVGVVAAGAAIVLLVSPHKDKNDVPGLALSVVLPAGSPAPAASSQGTKGSDPDLPDDPSAPDVRTRPERVKKRNRH